MRYDGSVLLKECVTKLYHEVKKDYVKEDPRIIVGLDTLGFTDGQVVALVDDEFNSRLNKKLKQTRDGFLEIKYHGRRPPPKYFTKELEDIGKLCSAGGRKDMNAGYYNHGCDAIFLNPVYVVDTFLLNIFGSCGRESRGKLKTLLRHELAHRDLTEATPYREMLGLFLDYCSVIYSLKPEDRPQEEVITSSGDDLIGTSRGTLLSDITRLREALGRSTKHGEKQAIQASLGMLECADKIKSLYIDHLDEALTSAIGRLSDTLTETPDNHRAFVLLLKHFEEMIRLNGIRESITKAREAIEESWNDNRSVVDVLGIKIE